MKTTKIILVGGFLGAGKTTLLWEAAQRILQKGQSVGLITNDQAPELVDSALLSRDGLKVEEVSGSCFCCNFKGFIDAIQQIRRDAPADVIIAEPVGSCTDLSATIIQPLKKFWSRDFAVAPLTVLADPARLASILDGGNAGLHEDAAYIFRKQLEEGDIVAITKSDSYAPALIEALEKRTVEAYPQASVFVISATTGEGIEPWLDEVMRRNRAGGAGGKLAIVDYDIYAHGEAVLGWLNGTVRLSGENADWNALTRQFLQTLAQRFDSAGLAVGHVKIIVENSSGQYIAGNLTGTDRTFALRGAVDLGNEIKLTINARVETSPEDLDAIVRQTLDAVVADQCTATMIAWRYLTPGRPQPTYRFTEVV